MFNRKIMIILGFAVLSSLVGCNYVSNKELDDITNQITITDNLTINEIEDRIIKLVYKVYSPQSEKDLADGLDRIKDICTDDEYKLLVQQLNKYDSDIKMSISDVVVKYSNGNDNSDHMRHVYTEFTVSNGKIEKEVLLEFVINPNNKIFKHLIWQNTKMK